ncbi:MAG: hypothetical protein J1E16_03895 [Muribaculaceae bacterium]|nr:hypothetical protein [Muribaculaceae bacterium]
MKRINLYKVLAATILMASSAAFVGCNDQPDKFEMTAGVPTIKYIRLTDPEKSDSLLNQAFMETTICLVGENLTSIHKLWFNDQPAILNTSLITANTLIVDIPSKIPDEITNKIYMETRDGALCDYDFTVLVPSPVITSMQNEWVKPGDEAVIKGRYFVNDANYPISVTMPGNIKVPNENITDVTETELHFIVPAESDGTSGQVSVATMYGSAKSPFYFHDQRGMLFDFDGISPLSFDGGVWHPHSAIEDENSLSGLYIQFGDGETVLDDNTWDESHFFAEYWAGSWDDPEFPAYGQGMKINDLIDFSNWENMSLKFEMQIPSSNPWSAASMQIIFASAESIHIQAASWDFFNGDASLQAPRAMYRPWQSAAGNSFHTNGEWITVTIPLSSFTYNMAGEACANQFSGPESFGSFQISITQGGISTEKECTPVIRLDNIRAVENL